MRVELHPKSTLRNGELLRVVDIQDGYFNAVTLRAERSAILRRIPPEFLEKELRESVLADAFNEILEKACAAGIAEERLGYKFDEPAPHRIQGHCMECHKPMMIWNTASHPMCKKCMKEQTG